MGQRHHIKSLPATGRAAAEYPQATRAHVHNLTQAFYWKLISMFFNELKPQGFWLTKKPVGTLLRNTLPVSAPWPFLQ
jgi:hypothetical protein